MPIAYLRKVGHVIIAGVSLMEQLENVVDLVNLSAFYTTVIIRHMG